MPNVPASGPGTDDPSPGAAKSSGLGRWAAEYAGDLHRFLAKRRIIESDIKDVCQEVYLRLLRFQRTEVVQNPQAYLFRVAANVAHDFRLRQQRFSPMEPEQLEEAAPTPTPEQTADSAVRSRRLLEALSALSPLSRAALALQIQEELTYEEIAVRLNVSRRSVKRAVARGYALLREILSDVD